MSDYDKSLHRHDKNRRWSHGKQRLKMCVFRRLRKTGSEGAYMTCSGRPFQIRAAATGKARSPMVDNRVWRTTSDDDEADREVCIIPSTTYVSPLQLIFNCVVDINSLKSGLAVFKSNNLNKKFSITFLGFF